jgi:sulfur carrier protein ThiS
VTGGHRLGGVPLVVLAVRCQVGKESVGRRPRVRPPLEDVLGEGAATVREALDQVFSANPRLRGYVLDDQGRLRRHVVVFVDGEMVADRERLSDPVRPASSVLVMQALSGG